MTETTVNCWNWWPDLSTAIILIHQFIHWALEYNWRKTDDTCRIYGQRCLVLTLPLAWWCTSLLSVWRLFRTDRENAWTKGEKRISLPDNILHTFCSWRNWILMGWKFQIDTSGVFSGSPTLILGRFIPQKKARGYQRTVFCIMTFFAPEWQACETWPSIRSRESCFRSEAREEDSIPCFQMDHALSHNQGYQVECFRFVLPLEH